MKKSKLPLKITLAILFCTTISSVNAQTFEWARSFGGNGSDTGANIIIDSLGNVYKTGSFRETVDFDPGPGIVNSTSSGNSDVFIHKMSQSLTGLVEIAKDVQKKAYPNPSKGLVQLTFGEPLKNVAITLTDMQGRIVFEQYLESVSHEQIEIEGAVGVYFLYVKTPQGQSVVKLVKK